MSQYLNFPSLYRCCFSQPFWKFSFSLCRTELSVIRAILISLHLMACEAFFRAVTKPCEVIFFKIILSRWHRTAFSVPLVFIYLSRVQIDVIFSVPVLFLWVASAAPLVQVWDTRCVHTRIPEVLQSHNNIHSVLFPLLSLSSEQESSFQAFAVVFFPGVESPKVVVLVAVTSVRKGQPFF